MGACFTAQTVKAKDEKELRAKFRELVEEAQYMHGHGGYTGTFAEKDGIVVLRPPSGQKFWTTDQLDETDVADDKWGPVAAGLIAEGTYYLCGYCSC
jgi:hypothetical protein